MPHLENILRPITIVGNGRSGTSLISQIFKLHPECVYKGETVNLIHSVWKSMECSLGPKQQPEIPELIRQQFLQLFPSTERYWMHKPIGVPFVRNMFPDEDEFLSWFWRILDQVFPQATYFTVLRHPLDVVLSSSRWWNIPFHQVMESNRIVAKLLIHPDSKVKHAINYHQLIEDPEPHVKKLFRYLNVPFVRRTLEAFDAVHVANPGAEESDSSLEQRKQSSFSHADKWTEIPKHLLTEKYRTAIEACWNHFDCDFSGWPNY
jgi:Sulfotransferase family